MDGQVAVDSEPVELCVLLPPGSNEVALDLWSEGASSAVSDRSDAGSESDEVFEDACAYLEEVPIASEQQNPPIAVDDKPGHQGPVRRWCHNVNSVLITIGMMLGLIFAFFQYRQQAWSNRLTALQTCLALEQSAESLANSSFCNKTLHQEVRGVQRFYVKRENATLVTHPHALLLARIRLPIAAAVLVCIISVCGFTIAFFILSNRFGSTEEIRPGPFAAPLHVSNEIPRTTTTGIEGSVTSEIRQRFPLVPGTVEEHDAYIEGQYVLTQTMKTWTSVTQYEEEQGFESVNPTNPPILIVDEEGEWFGRVIGNNDQKKSDNGDLASDDENQSIASVGLESLQKTPFGSQLSLNFYSKQKSKSSLRLEADAPESDTIADDLTPDEARSHAPDTDDNESRDLKSGFNTRIEEEDLDPTTSSTPLLNTANANLSPTKTLQELDDTSVRRRSTSISTQRTDEGQGLTRKLTRRLTRRRKETPDDDSLSSISKPPSKPIYSSVVDRVASLGRRRKETNASTGFDWTEQMQRAQWESDVKWQRFLDSVREEEGAGRSRSKSFGGYNSRY